MLAPASAMCRATKPDLRWHWHVASEMTVVVTAGIIARAALAWVGSRVMAGLVYGVTVHDPRTFATALVVLALAAAAATMVPARRAMRTQPAEVMRNE